MGVQRQWGGAENIILYDIKWQFLKTTKPITFNLSLVTLSCWTIYVSELTFKMMIEGAEKFLQAVRRQYYNNRVFLPVFTITPSQIQSSSLNLV